MAKRRKKKKISKAKRILTSFLALIVIIVAAFMYLKDMNDPAGDEGGPEVLDGASIRIHIIDVGQGDCTVFETADGNVLIDAGPNDHEDELRAYLKNKNLDSFKYAIFTHADEDHIGGADMVVKEFAVENVIMTDAKKTTKTFQYLVEGIEEKQINTILAEPEAEYLIGSLKIKILAPLPGMDKDDHNNYSVVTKLWYGENTFMLSGDAEVDSERAIVEKYGSGLKCDFLKVGHHGASNASTQEFINAVNPQIATISCGKDNSYGHPHAETLAKLSAINAKIYRTDELGSIVFECDGKSIVKK